MYLDKQKVWGQMVKMGIYKDGELARLVGVSKQAASQWLAHDSRIGTKSLLRVCQVLKLTPDGVLDLSELEEEVEVQDEYWKE